MNPYPSRTAPDSRTPLCRACDCPAVYRSEVATSGRHWCAWHKNHDASSVCPVCQNQRLAV